MKHSNSSDLEAEESLEPPESSPDLPSLEPALGPVLIIFFGLRIQSCSGRMQFQRTQGNQSATPISTTRKMMTCVFCEVRSTFGFQNWESVSLRRKPTVTIIMRAW